MSDSILESYPTASISNATVGIVVDEKECHATFSTCSLTSSLRAGLVLSRLPYHPLMHLLEFIGPPNEFLHMSLVCKAWYDYFDPKDTLLWQLIATCFHIDTFHLPTTKASSTRNSERVITLRSRTNIKKLFMQAYAKKKKEIQEKHDFLIIEAKRILDRNRDCAAFLKKLIYKMFPPQIISKDKEHTNAQHANNMNAEISDNNEVLDDPLQSPDKKKRKKSKQSNANQYHNPDFDVNWRCETIEDYSLLALSARYCHLKCMKFLCDTFPSIDINIKDMGGFTPLHICAYRGYFPGVQYCVKQGANLKLLGRLRSGIPLSAEHWSAVQGNNEIFHYLRGIRLKKEALAKGKEKVAPSSSSDQVVCLEGTGSDIPGIQSQEMFHEQHPLALLSYAATENMNDFANTSLQTELSAAELAITSSCAHLSQNNNGFSSPSFVQVSSNVDLAFPSSPSTEVPMSSTSNLLSPLHSSQPVYVRGEGVYCICGSGYFGEMVACDMENCPIEWFHFECVGLTKEPEGTWYCHGCRGESFSQPIRVRTRSLVKKRKINKAEPRKKKEKTNDSITASVSGEEAQSSSSLSEQNNEIPVIHSLISTTL